MTSSADTSSSNTLSVTDLWFAALDSQPIIVRGETWVIEVVGIHDCEDGLWIQVRRAGSAQNAAVLRVDPAGTPSRALASIAARLAGTSGGDVVDARASLTSV